MAGGRPTDYTQDKADKICAMLSEGMSLRTVCKDDELPSTQTVFSWLRTYPEFLDQYTRAKQESADALTDEMLDISDDSTNDWMESHGDDAGYRANGDNIQRSRLRIETRKWLASKLKPKKYGDKIQQEHSGSIDTGMTEDQMDARIKQLQDELKG